MKRSWVRLVAALAAMTFMLTACDDDTQTKETNSMYCELIDPKTIQPIAGSDDITDIGGPVPKDDYRRIQCVLSVPGNRQPLLSLYEFELWSTDTAQVERDKATAAMTKHAKDDPEHYVALKADGDDLGYAWYSGDTAAAILLTDKRSISVTAPATAQQAAEFTPLMLKVAQEIDQNLDAWDAKNPS